MIYMRCIYDGDTTYVGKTSVADVDISCLQLSVHVHASANQTAVNTDHLMWCVEVSHLCGIEDGGQVQHS